MELYASGFNAWNQLNFESPASHDEPEDLHQFTSYETGFAALTSAGDVYTWGDERYAACLGREVTEDTPAEQPALVTALQDLPTGPVSKIAAGGYMLAALTSGDDLYLWGGHPGRKAILADVADEPTPIDMDGRDIVDVAVGESHLVVLTTEGEVFVVGDNGNGQLGLPGKSVESWTRVELNLQDERRAVGVAAGPRNSFIIVQKRET
ncbi:Regulator of chromosome condensation [Cytospora mali]|uniref:Regulator of chromosome condensation n=1 Tax=Cytospora mali TaxID=578113 RepID=A0A194V1E5_CYTMA|nr:Regulator of chromosome condensation [Valsa mali var. pyri (nom. inval.)]